MTDATYALHMALLRMAKGMLQAWEKWVVVTSGSIELPRPKTPDLTSRLSARQTGDTTQSTVRGDDRCVRSTVPDR